MSSVWPLPATPAIADDLAGPDREADAVDDRLALAPDRQVASLEDDGAPACGGPLLDGQIDGPPGHGADDLARGGLARRQARDAAVAQHGDAVGDRHHLVELVGDEEDRAPVGGEVADDAEQAVALLRRQDRGRLVEDEDARVAIERLQDLDALAHADRKPADDRVRIDLEVIAVGRARATWRRAARRSMKPRARGSRP